MVGYCSVFNVLKYCNKNRSYGYESFGYVIGGRSVVFAVYSSSSTNNTDRQDIAEQLLKVSNLRQM